MKQVIILTVVILMAGIALAGDPNSMPNPTAQNRVIVCVDQVHQTVTIRMKVTADGAFVARAVNFGFAEFFWDRFYRIFTKKVKEIHATFAVQVARDKSIETLQAEADELDK